MRTLQHHVQQIFRKFGFVVKRFSSTPEGQIAAILRHYEIDLVLDVGANVGQYAKMLRQELAFKGSIASFEPMRREFEQLKQEFQHDPHWQGFNIGLGNESAELTINIAGNSASSSLLPANPRLFDVAPQTTYRGTEQVKVHTLDSLTGELDLRKHRTYLKIDAQGYESRILAGAEGALEYIDTVQLEMSLTPMYEGGLSFDELFPYMRAKGYKLQHVIPGFWDRSTGELLEMDGVFHRINKNPLPR